MGTVFNYGQYEVDIDVERTRLFYDKARLVSSGCACSGCRNFEKAVNNLPSEVEDDVDGYLISEEWTEINCIDYVIRYRLETLRNGKLAMGVEFDFYNIA